MFHECLGSGVPGIAVVVDIDEQDIVAALGLVAQRDDVRQLFLYGGREAFRVLVVVRVEHVNDDERGLRHLEREPTAKPTL